MSEITQAEFISAISGIKLEADKYYSNFQNLLKHERIIIAYVNQLSTKVDSRHMPIPVPVLPEIVEIGQ